ncbi:unnamed protein product [Meloidogyne enterolobii]|uniref:Uncharacterized protein n=1 Tax=Meloidogyne enterolobii TaxID=390850 RepID=A0ACB0ZRN0_MELEN
MSTRSLVDIHKLFFLVILLFLCNEIFLLFFSNIGYVGILLIIIPFRICRHL